MPKTIAELHAKRGALSTTDLMELVSVGDLTDSAAGSSIRITLLELKELLDSLIPATSGDGSPEGVVTAPPGRTYWDAFNNEFYVKDTGTGNTGWISLITLGS